MPEVAAAEKRVGLHYTRARKCFIDTAGLNARAAAISAKRQEYAALKAQFDKLITDAKAIIATNGE